MNRSEIGRVQRAIAGLEIRLRGMAYYDTIRIGS